MVMADTVVRPGGDAAIVRVHGTAKALAIVTECTPRYCRADPVAGGRQAVAEAWRNLTAVGARPLAITDCMNFGNPERPEIMGQFAGCIEGMAEACRALDFPVVSGNVSLYNETNGQAVLPTPEIGGLGLLADLSRRAGLAFQRAGATVLLLGDSAGHLAQSQYQRVLLGRSEGPPPPVDLAAERRNGNFVRGLIADGTVAVCHDLSEGGLLVALAEMALASGIGATLRPHDEAMPEHAWWFGEDQGRYVVTAGDDAADAVLRRAAEAGVPARCVAATGGDALTLADGVSISIGSLREAHEGWLPAFMADGTASG